MSSHRREVREAILDTTWALAIERGLLAVTMSEIAERTGIGRATLYKYFPDIEAIVLAAHQRHVSAHLERLRKIGDESGDARARLEALIEAYALILYHRNNHGTELAALVHRGDRVALAEQQLVDLIREMIAEAVESGDVRDDIGAEELARYCLHALSAAGTLPSEAAVRRLVTVILSGLRPPPVPATPLRRRRSAARPD